MSQSRWEHFQHMADIGVRGYGPTLNEAFRQAARAMMAVIVDLNRVSKIDSVVVQCQAPDNEILFVDWLNRIVYEIATRDMIFCDFDVTLQNQQLTATLHGEYINIEKHQPTVEVKGATFTALKVQFENGEWLAQCVVDV